MRFQAFRVAGRRRRFSVSSHPEAFDAPTFQMHSTEAPDNSTNLIRPILTRSLASPTRQKQPSSTCLAWSLREVLQTRSCVLRGQRGSLQNFGASSQGFQAGLPNLYPPAISAVQTCACRLRAVFRGGVTMPLSPYSIHPWGLQVSFGRADSGIGCTLTANRSQSPRVGAAFLSVSDFF